MRFSDYLREDRTNIHMKARTKADAIKELAELVRDADEVTDFDQFVQDVFEREALASTGIGNRAAAPHARTDAVNRFVIAVGRSQEGIDFDSIDGQPVKVFFLMGTPTSPLGNYLKMLAHLTRLLHERDFVDNLLKAESAAEVVAYFRNAEK
jgi:PTS system fructose-specific IIC component